MKRSRLDRFIAYHCQIPKSQVRLAVAQSRVQVNGEVVKQVQMLVSEFDEILFDGVCVAQRQPCYLMLNKPAGILSATTDDAFTTVIDLVPDELCVDKASLHYAGRLDRATTGLMLLTNDGAWSRAIAQAQQKIKKYYRVTLANRLQQSDIDAFAKGFYFDYEQTWTRPAQLEIVSDYEAVVVIDEGKYHQVKRMFAQCGNRVVKLHRYRIGDLLLDSNLIEGRCRALSAHEIALF